MKRTALITGGTRGIGLGISVELAKAGFNLVMNGVREEGAVRGVLDELSGRGAKVVYARGDISVSRDRTMLLEKALEAFGSVHVLVNNAGVGPLNRKDILETTEESFDRVMGINLKGPYFLTQLVARQMIERKRRDADFQGVIINISSISATVASVNRGEYCVSKAGISMITRLWAVRLGEFGIPVYEIRPGIIDTDMTAGVRDQYDRLIREGLCLQQRWGVPSDVGKVASAMAMGSMPYSTGEVVHVDGGLTVPRL